MRRRSLVAIGVMIAAAWWWSRSGSADRDDTQTTDSDEPSLADRGGRRAKLGPLSRLTTDHHTGASSVEISGRVIADEGPIEDAEVVFRASGGEYATHSSDDGSYSITVPAGSYRAFVRSEHAVTLAAADSPRTPRAHTRDEVGRARDSLAPLIAADHDLTYDFKVAAAVMIHGVVIDDQHRPVSGAVVSTSSYRDAGSYDAVIDGSDLGETDSQGRFSMLVPPGLQRIVADHPNLALMTAAEIDVMVNVEPSEVTLVMGGACVISGRVVYSDGRPAGEGAIEIADDADEPSIYAPDGTIDGDGRFHYLTRSTTKVRLRAWPWKAPPSSDRAFDCSDFRAHRDVVFEIPVAEQPDASGHLVDSEGAPVGLAYIDITPLDPGGISQQERTAPDGTWSIYRLPAGRYQIIARSTRYGEVITEVEVPVHGVDLMYPKLGRIVGKAPLIEQGSITASWSGCGGATARGEPPVSRVIPVIDHHFTIDGVPACELELSVDWGIEHTTTSLVVDPGGVGVITVMIGPRQPTQVTGVVRRSDGRPAPGVLVISGDEPSQVTTDDNGRFTIASSIGAAVHAIANDGDQRALAIVEQANAELTLTLESSDSVEVHAGEDPDTL